MNDQDKKAKERARRQARSGAAARPGAEAVSTEEAARLDQRIASKQEAGNKQKVEASRETKASTGSKQQSADGDAAVKSRARRTPSSQVKPGAYFEKDAPREVPVQQLSQLENDIASKSRASHGVSSSDGRPAELSQLEQDIAAKNRARRNTTSSAVAATAPGAHAQLSSLEDQVATKSRRANAQAVVSSTAPGAHAQLDDMEARIAAKGRRGSPTAETAPGARPQLNNIEDRVAAKSRRATGTDAAAATPGAKAELNDLEGRIASKASVGSGGRTSQLDDLEEQIAAKTRAARGSRATEVSRLDERISAKIGNEDSAAPMRNVGGVAPTIVSLPGEEEPQGYDGQFYDDALVKQEKEKMAMESAPPQESAPRNTADRGIINSPDVEFGQHGNGLAVAVAVTPEEEDAFIPAAIEYDPDSKPPIYKNRRFRLYGIVGFILLAVIVVGVSIGVTSGGDESAPTMAPTSYRASLGIQDQIIAVVGEEAMISDDPMVPTFQKQAMDWIRSTIHKRMCHRIDKHHFSLFLRQVFGRFEALYRNPSFRTGADGTNARSFRTRGLYTFVAATDFLLKASPPALHRHGTASGRKGTD